MIDIILNLTNVIAVFVIVDHFKGKKKYIAITILVCINVVVLIYGLFS